MAINEKEKIIETRCLHWLNSQRDVFAIKLENTAPFNEQLQTRIKKGRFTPKGIMDAIVFTKDNTFAIEFKTTTGKQSLEQKAFEEKLKSLDIGYYVVRSLDECREALEKERLKRIC